MKNEPDIIKQLREEEKQKKIQYTTSQNTSQTVTTFEKAQENTEKQTVPHPFDNTNQQNVELQNLEEVYETVFENSAVGITLVDKDERIISWNKYVETLLNLNHKDLFMKPIASLYPPDEWQRIRAENIRQKGMQYHLETRMLKKNYQPFDVEISLSILKDHEGKIRGSIGIITDISKRKQMEIALETSGKIFKQLYETAPVPYHTLSPIGLITNVNEKWCQILGFSRDEVIGRSIFDFVIPTERESAR
ncbi:MAG: PAS domain S-box protein, partial [Methanobacteriota archaeon]